MTEDTKKRIHLIYGIVLSVSLAVAGILLIIACVGIYNSGDRPFSREAVAAAFSGIAVPVYLCLVLIAGGWVLDALLPCPKGKLPVEKQYPVILQRLHEKLDITGCSQRQGIEKEQRSRKLHSLISLALLAVGSIVFLCYGMNPANFHQSEITESMEKAMYVLLPCMAVPFGYSVFAAFHARASIQREIGLVRQALAGAPAGTKKAEAKIASVRLPWLRYCLLAVALVILVYGYFAGGTNDVLTKAINICTECVGLG